MAQARRDDLPDKHSRIFFERGLDRNLLICPSGAIARWPDEPTGRATCAPDDKFRATHQLRAAIAMGFARAQPILRARIPDSRETQSGRKPLRRCGKKSAGRWINGTFASLAVGAFIKLITPWSEFNDATHGLGWTATGRRSSRAVSGRRKNTGFRA